jgi:hypothetical protein
MNEPAEKDSFAALWNELESLPDGTKAELANGEVRVMPRPSFRHARTTSKLGATLEGSFGFDGDENELGQARRPQSMNPQSPRQRSRRFASSMKPQSPRQ